EQGKRGRQGDAQEAIHDGWFLFLGSIIGKNFPVEYRPKQGQTTLFECRPTPRRKRSRENVVCPGFGLSPCPGGVYGSQARVVGKDDGVRRQREVRCRLPVSAT